MHLKMLSGKCRPLCLEGDELTWKADVYNQIKFFEEFPILQLPTPHYDDDENDDNGNSNSTFWYVICKISLGKIQKWIDLFGKTF